MIVEIVRTYYGVWHPEGKAAVARLEELGIPAERIPADGAPVEIHKRGKRYVAEYWEFDTPIQVAGGSPVKTKKKLVLEDYIEQNQ